MRARIPDTLHRLRPTRPRRRDVPAPPAPASAPGGCVPANAEPVEPELRVREAGGPEDRAHYACSCGLAFTADVSTSVACPHCGAEQAW